MIIAAAGNIDRNGNGDNLNTNDYKMLAEGLAQNGFASLRYDKRGKVVKKAGFDCMGKNARVTSVSS